jgi:hypothetical protein
MRKVFFAVALVLLVASGALAGPVNLQKIKVIPGVGVAASLVNVVVWNATSDTHKWVVCRMAFYDNNDDLITTARFLVQSIGPYGTAPCEFVTVPLDNMARYTFMSEWD